MEKNCKTCFETFYVLPYRKITAKFCSRVCKHIFQKGKPSCFPEGLIKGRGWFKGRNALAISISKKSKNFHHSIETKRKISEKNIGKTSGEKHYKWKMNRDEIFLKRRAHIGTEYNNWRKQVWLRDNFKCKIANPDCKGRIEAHHILSWRDYPELRYQINNGITLCHFHHPFKRMDEIKLSPYFQNMITPNEKFNE